MVFKNRRNDVCKRLNKIVTDHFDKLRHVVVAIAMSCYFLRSNKLENVMLYADI
jgi:glycosyltransferase A (GT-A) superfamily protein (DUF2064 family)